MILAILKLIRFQNLLIIAFTQYLIRHLVIEPFLKINGFELQLDHLHFLLLVLSTLFIAAAGYTINDYFDTKTDSVNKPGKVIIDRQISRPFAINLHMIFNLIGVGLGIYLSFHIKIPAVAILFLLTAGLLWFYSTNYKRQLIIGNFLVSLLVGSVPISVILFELPLLNREYGEIMINAGASFNYIFYWVAGFSFFAFFTNFIREIIKDTEDYEGDRTYGMNTLPVKIGITATRIVIIFLVLALIAILSFLLIRYILFSTQEFDYISASYFFITLFLPLLFIIFQIAVAKTKRDYHISSQILKVVMLFGVLYSVVVFYMVTYELN